MSLWACLGIVLVAALIVQGWLRFGFGRREPWGDEKEYLQRANSRDPFAPGLFLRPPLMTLFVLAAGRTETAVRNALALVAIGTVLLVTAAGYLSGGPSTALGCGLMFLLLPDRMVLSQHLKPDTLLALCHALVLLMLVCLADRDVPVWSFGLVGAAAAMARTEALAILGALAMHPMVREAPSPTRALVELCSPAAVGIAVVILYNRWRYGMSRLETTTDFNLAVLAEEHRLAPGSSVPVERVLMPTTAARWLRLGSDERRMAARAAVGEIRRRPLRYLRGLAERIWQMLGPDSFATQNLLDLRTGAYPDLSPRRRRLFVRLLRPSFPLLLALAAAGVGHVPGAVDFSLVVSALTLLSVCLIHSRTRYRYPLLPALSLAAIGGLRALAGPSIDWAAWAALVFVATIALAAPPRPELVDG